MIPKYPMPVLTYINNHQHWSNKHKKLLITLLQNISENNAVHKIQFPDAEYYPDFVLGTTFAGYRLFGGNKGRHLFLSPVTDFANTLLDYKNFPTFRNIPEVQVALEPSQKIHFLLEGLEPNEFLQERFIKSDISDTKVVNKRKWGAFDLGDTEVEFLTISYDIALLNKTTFYNNGEIISYEAALKELKLSSFRK